MEGPEAQEYCPICGALWEDCQCGMVWDEDDPALIWKENHDADMQEPGLREAVRAQSREPEPQPADVLQYPLPVGGLGQEESKDEGEEGGKEICRQA